MSFGIGRPTLLPRLTCCEAGRNHRHGHREQAPGYGFVEGELGANAATGSMFGYHRVPILST